MHSLSSTKNIHKNLEIYTVGELTLEVQYGSISKGIWEMFNISETSHLADYPENWNGTQRWMPSPQE